MKGLTTEEVNIRVQNGQTNAMPKNSENGIRDILMRHVFTLFNLLNLVLAGLLLAVGSYRNMLFCGVVVSNAVIGVWNEVRAKKEHDRLKLLHEGKFSVLRDEKEEKLSSADLVLDDVVLLTRGNQIPADAVVLDGMADADESMLTGESVPIHKLPGSTVYAGSFLVSGRVTVRLNAVGLNSFAGKLQQKARKAKQSKSRLMEDMKRLIRIISIALIPIGVLLYWRQSGLPGATVEKSVTATVGAMVGMIPEGLLLLTSVSLTAGVLKLGKRKALVNELYGIESLARVDVLCIDKTGTLTNGEMTYRETISLAGKSEEELLNCLSSVLHAQNEDTPTNRALLSACPGQYREDPEQVIAFSSERKWSAARFDGLGTLILGAPEKLLTGEYLRIAQNHAAQGLRVLALLHSDKLLTEEKLPDNAVPYALFCLQDMLRPNVEKTLQYFQEQDVKVMVLSGDSAFTVSKTAQNAGVPGAQAFVDMSAIQGARDYEALCRENIVFGRVTPEDKKGLVEALKSQGHTVAMIGDGVNDIPALKEADCSIAISGGSDAACRVAQVTLMDADFNLLPEIVFEGRRVINNISRASSLFLIKNMFSLFLSLALLFLPLTYPFQPIQLTLISTLTIGLPSFLLAFQPNKERINGHFLQNVIRRALPGGLCTSLLVLILMIISKDKSISAVTASTMATYAAGYSGIIALLLVCVPLNAMRAGVLVLMSGGFTAAAVIFSKLLYLVPLQRPEWLMMIFIVPIAPILQIGLERLLKIILHKRGGTKS